jgi:exodeoxyribonuclease VII large subunit
MKKEYQELAAVLHSVKSNLENAFPSSIWVVAEIAKINVNQKGHCYLELSQQENGVQLASARGNIWRSKWVLLEPYFRSVTGATLDVGMKVLVKARVTFHEVYGFSLNIDDIDPQFTIGEKEMKRKQTIEQLTKEGLMNMQKQLSLARIPYRLAVISASTAAGFGDFKKHLLGNEYGYVFDVQLFEALMQGVQSPESICGAIRQILSAPVHFDAVLILRGGGSELDLACYDDYELASTIARCPIPVLTAIGHEQDFHIADMVAYDYVKTPTALADYFLSIYEAEDERLSAYEQRLALAFGNRFASMSSRLDGLGMRIRHSAASRVQNASHKIDMTQAELRNSVRMRLESQFHGIDRMSDKIMHGVASRISSSEQILDRVENRIDRKAENALASASSHIDKVVLSINRRIDKILADAASHLLTIETRISSTDPRRVLQRGFVLALDNNGVKMSSASHSRVGDRVQMMFADGTLKCGILEIDRHSNLPDEEEAAKSSAEGA